MIPLKKVDILLLSLFVILFILSFFVIKSFLVPLIFSLLLVYLLHPVYVRLRKFLFNCHILASLLIISVFIMVTIVPLSFGVVQISKEFSYVQNQEVLSKLDTMSSDLKSYDVSIDLKTVYLNFTSSLKDFLNTLVFKIPELLFHIFILFFFYFYFSKNFDSEFNFFKRIFDDKRFLIIGKKLQKLINGVIYGQVVVRFIQALLFTTLYLLIGIQGAFFFGILTFLVAFIPILGTGIVWVPLLVLLFLKGTSITLPLLFLIGALIISTIDNFLIPYFISEQTNIGPVMTLVSIIGGIQIFGFYGVILGPFVLGFFLVLFDELLFSLRNQSQTLKKYIWSEKERKEFRSLHSQKEKESFIEKINLKYQKKQDSN